MTAKHLKRLRKICFSFPETTERISHGEETFFAGGKKVFAMCSGNHHNDGHTAVLCPAPVGLQQILVESSPKTYYKPPYVGGKGWIGIELDCINDRDLTEHLSEAWRMVAPRKLVSRVDSGAKKP